MGPQEPGRGQGEARWQTLGGGCRAITDAVEKGIEWLDENEDADAEEDKEQKKEVEEVVQPIISGLYGEGGMPGGGADDEDDETTRTTTTSFKRSAQTHAHTHTQRRF